MLTLLSFCNCLVTNFLLIHSFSWWFCLSSLRAGELGSFSDPLNGKRLRNCRTTVDIWLVKSTRFFSFSVGTCAVVFFIVLTDLHHERTRWCILFFSGSAEEKSPSTSILRELLAVRKLWCYRPSARHVKQSRHGGTWSTHDVGIQSTVT